ncbi:MAG: alkyl sulfatase dimerization domain-containing protein [Polyangiales bacterium]
MNVLEYAERAWSGEVDHATMRPELLSPGIAPMDGRLAFVCAFSNVLALDTDDGLVLVDTSSPFHAGAVHALVRGWSPRLAHTAVYTHGHVDHVFGVAPFEDESRAQGRAVTVVAHRAVLDRFARYRLTSGYNGHINRRQFRLPAPMFPEHFRDPDVTFEDRMTLRVGGREVALFHDRGETDDHLWAWVPDARAIYTGDLFIWASPNCGNPQKVQRYPREWAAALRKMDALGAERLFPGHGPPILGAQRVRQALTETAALLESLVEQTLRAMNSGATLDEVLRAVRPPAALLHRPYLRPVYDDPQFIVRNLWRLYGGWWDGNPARLKPPRDAELSAALCDAAGGAAVLAERARVAMLQGRSELAGSLAQFAMDAAPKDPVVRAVYREVNEERAREETSLMAQSIFREAAEKA